MESTLHLTPKPLLHTADEECQILCHSHQWVDMIDRTVSALQAALTTNMAQSNELFQKIAAPFSLTAPNHRANGKYHQDDCPSGPAPADLNTPKYYKGKDWFFCTKCGRDGVWEK